MTSGCCVFLQEPKQAQLSYVYMQENRHYFYDIVPSDLLDVLCHFRRLAVIHDKL